MLEKQYATLYPLNFWQSSASQEFKISSFPPAVNVASGPYVRSSWQTSAPGRCPARSHHLPGEVLGLQKFAGDRLCDSRLVFRSWDVQTGPGPSPLEATNWDLTFPSRNGLNTLTKLALCVWPHWASTLKVQVLHNHIHPPKPVL